MADRICDKRPCTPLGQALPTLELATVNSNLVITTTFSKSSAQTPLRVTLLYCPFCGMRLDADIVEALYRARGNAVSVERVKWHGRSK